LPKSKFEDIYQDMRRQIKNGSYAGMLPSENNLTKTYECSRNTVRRAISLLAEAGYVQSLHGKGVQIIYQPHEETQFTLGGIESFAESAQRNHLDAATEVVKLEKLICDAELSKMTGFAVGSDVIYVLRVRRLSGVAAILDTNYFLSAYVPDLTEEIARKSIYAHLEQELGMRIITSKRRITAERATAQDKKLLDLKDYDFVAVVTGHTYNDSGVCFEYTESRHRPDYFAFYTSAVRAGR